MGRILKLTESECSWDWLAATAMDTWQNGSLCPHICCIWLKPLSLVTNSSVIVEILRMLPSSHDFNLLRKANDH